jgi:hypothetical protein
MIDEGDCGAVGGMKIGRGNRSTRRKPAPAPTLSTTMTLDKVLNELKSNGNIIYKSKQGCAYIDYIALIARYTPALQEMLITLKKLK